MHILLISGLSGSGKSIALGTLEDHGIHCIDNMPPPLLPDYVRTQMELGTEQTAIAIDARARTEDLEQLPQLLEKIHGMACKTTVVFLDASTETLIRRYSDTRRRHPLADQVPTLREAVERERLSLTTLANLADLRFDTTNTDVHELRSQILQRLAIERKPISVLLQSFAFRNGCPSDSDFVFDCRALPNPYWDLELRGRDGMDLAVADFLSSEPKVQKMQEDLERFLRDWIPAFIDANRYYLNISIGCTGGRHRSVYMVEQLATRITDIPQIHSAVRHRDLKKS